MENECKFCGKKPLLRVAYTISTNQICGRKLDEKGDKDNEAKEL